MSTQSTAIIDRQISAAPRLPETVTEANHRVANSLAIIAGLVHRQTTALRRRTGSMDLAEVRQLLETLGSRIGIVAGLHRRLAEDSDGRQRSAIDLAHYVEEVAAAVVDFLSPAGQMTLGHDLATGCFAESQRALSLGLMVGELVTNAVKFAHPAGVRGRITVSCLSRPDGAIIVGVSDDGVGLPEGFDPTRKGATHGLPMVRGLAAQIGAEISFNSSELGLTVALTLPPEREL